MDEMKHSSQDLQGGHSAEATEILCKQALEEADKRYQENAKEYGVNVVTLQKDIYTRFLDDPKEDFHYEKRFVVLCNEDNIKGRKALIIAIMAVMSDCKRGKWEAYFAHDPFHAQKAFFLRSISWHKDIWLRCYSLNHKLTVHRRQIPTKYALLCFGSENFNMQRVTSISLNRMHEWAQQILIRHKCDLKKPEDIMRMLEVKEFDVNRMYTTQLAKLKAEVENIQRAKNSATKKAQRAKNAAAKKAQRAAAEAAKKRQLDKDAAAEAAKKPKLEKDAGASAVGRDPMEELQRLKEQIEAHEDMMSKWPKP
jgi:hypothetical protein